MLSEGSETVSELQLVSALVVASELAARSAPVKVLVSDVVSTVVLAPELAVS